MERDSKIKFKGDLGKKEISMLIICPKEFFDLLNPLIKTRIESIFCIPVEVSHAEQVHDVTEKVNYSLFDSIIIAVDTTKENISILVDTLSGISSEFLVARTILINGSSGLCQYECALKLKQVAKTFNINYINSEIKDSVSCSQLVDKIIHLVGLTTGISRGKSVLIPTAAVLSSPM